MIEGPEELADRIEAEWQAHPFPAKAPPWRVKALLRELVDLLRDNIR